MLELEVHYTVSFTAREFASLCLKITSLHSSIEYPKKCTKSVGLTCELVVKLSSVRKSLHPPHSIPPQDS